uniref:Uma2 domain-containing protein n=1 Tax=Caenorhabditis tropicalis TaxID=1561998 RepID=A0A1I7V1K0_9PELO
MSFSIPFSQWKEMQRTMVVPREEFPYYTEQEYPITVPNSNLPGCPFIIHHIVTVVRIPVFYPVYVSEPIVIEENPFDWFEGCQIILPEGQLMLSVKYSD